MTLNKTFKHASFFALFFLFFLLFSPVKSLATGIDTPSLLDVQVTTDKRLEAKGLTPNNSRVLIYINGKYKKSANVSKIPQEEVNSFHYLSNQRLPAGKHKLLVVSQKQNSSIMSPPVSYDFKIFGDSPDSDPQKTDGSQNKQAQIHKTPAPTLIHPHSNNLSNVRPNILGLGTNHTRVKIYLDGELLAKTGFLYHSSGTAGFAITPSRDLKVGEHRIWAQAVDYAGRTSKRSNVLSFNINDVKAHKISTPPAPRILKPENNTVKPLEELYVSGVVEQKVDKIKIYIDGNLHSEIKPTISGNRSEFTHDLQDLSRGEHTVYVTSIKEGKESSISSKTDFTVTNPRINKGVKEGKTATSSPDTDINGKQKDQQTATSSSFFSDSQNFKYLIFGILILLVAAWIIWVNKDSIKNTFSSRQ